MHGDHSTAAVLLRVACRRGVDRANLLGHHGEMLAGRIARDGEVEPDVAVQLALIEDELSAIVELSKELALGYEFAGIRDQVLA